VTGGVPQLPFRTLVNPFTPLEVLSADQVEEIHQASLRILAEVGVEVLGDRAIDHLAAAGGTVDRGTRRVRLDPGFVEEAIATAPAEFTLHARNPDRNVVLGGRNLVFSSVGGPAFVTDLDRGRRAGNWHDFQDYVRLISALNVIHQEAGGPLEPTDLPVESRHLDMYACLATTLEWFGEPRQPLPPVEILDVPTPAWLASYHYRGGTLPPAGYQVRKRLMRGRTKRRGSSSHRAS